MNRKILVAAVALFICSLANAKCLRETFGDTICGQGPCTNGRDGRVYCAAERYGTAERDVQGEIVCGVGRCVQCLTDYIAGTVHAGHYFCTAA